MLYTCWLSNGLLILFRENMRLTKVIASVFIVGLLAMPVVPFADEIKPTIVPSQALLNLAHVKSYQLSDQISLMVSRDGLKSPRGMSVCDNPFYALIFMKAKIEGVAVVKVLVETATLKEQALLFSLSNEGGLSRPLMLQTISVNLYQQAQYIDMNIWAFYITKDNKVYTNFLQAQCMGD